MNATIQLRLSLSVKQFIALILPFFCMESDMLLGYAMGMRERFYSIYSHRFIRAAVCVPSLRVADPAFNVERTLALARRASEAKVAVALFPELGISAYSNEDLFHQDALLEATKTAIEHLVRESEGLVSVL